MIGSLLMLMFLASLPWAWATFYGTSTFSLRPAVVAVIPLVIYVFIKGGIRLKYSQYKLLAILSLILLIWLVPTFYNDYPHWSRPKVMSIFVYALEGYFAAKAYLILKSGQNWDVYWYFVGGGFLISCAVSYYVAFGSLVPNTSIASSEEFIFNSLYANMSDPSQSSGKGIRHTMAIAPVIIMALIIHGRESIFRPINIIFILFSIYLILFTFSRSAWLVAFLILLLFFKLLYGDITKYFVRIFVLGFVALILVVILGVMFPDKFIWLGSILGDRLADSDSADGRLWILSHIFTDTSFSEYIFGYNREVQLSPHNMILDALMQTGIFGALAALILVGYAMRIYFRGLFLGGYENIVAAAFVAPALVRMFTAGSGMLHLTELFGLCVAANLKHVKINNNTKKMNEVSPIINDRASVKLR